MFLLDLHILSRRNTPNFKHYSLFSGGVHSIQ
jgi:hypothetical protein